MAWLRPGLPSILEIGMSGITGSVKLFRGPEVESVHRVHMVVQGPEGKAWVGDPAFRVCVRSAAKPFQALPLVEDGVARAMGLSGEELALCCASHSGEPGHVEGVRRLLELAGLEEDALACGPHPPFHGESARDLVRRGEAPGRIHHNCSGKHAGMLLLARYGGWPTDGYQRLDHPVQLRILESVQRVVGALDEELGMAVDGCGVPCFFLPLDRLAMGYLALARDPGGPAGELLRAMASHPWWVAGTGRFCTRIMEATSGRVVAKVGAEGVYGAVAVERGVAVALKVEDGAGRAAEAALIQVLLTLLPEMGDDLRGLKPAPVRNSRMEEVGSVGVELPFQLQGRIAGLVAEGRQGRGGVAAMDTGPGGRTRDGA